MPMPDPRGSPHTLKQLRNWAEVFLVFPLETTRILFSLSFLSEFRGLRQWALWAGSVSAGRGFQYIRCIRATLSSIPGLLRTWCP